MEFQIDPILLGLDEPEEKNTVLKGLRQCYCLLTSAIFTKDEVDWLRGNDGWLGSTIL